MENKNNDSLTIDGTDNEIKPINNEVNNNAIRNFLNIPRYIHLKNLPILSIINGTSTIQGDRDDSYN